MTPPGLAVLKELSPKSNEFCRYEGNPSSSHSSPLLC